MPEEGSHGVAADAAECSTDESGVKLSPQPALPRCLPFLASESLLKSARIWGRPPGSNRRPADYEAAPCQVVSLIVLAFYHAFKDLRND